MGDSSLQVSDLMSTDTVTLQRNDRLALADHAMKERAIRHMPVVDDSGQVCGILSQRDLFRGDAGQRGGQGGHGQPGNYNNPNDTDTTGGMYYDRAQDRLPAGY